MITSIPAFLMMFSLLFISVSLKLKVTNHANLKYSTNLQFQANSNGIIDLSKDIPICKSYHKPDLMALFWLLKPEGDSDTRFWPIKLHQLLECTYEVMDIESKNILTETVISRNNIADNVERSELEIEVRSLDNWDTTL